MTEQTGLQSLRDVLVRTINPSQFLGQGKGARTYRFAEATGLSDYILRVEEQTRGVDDPAFEAKAVAALKKDISFTPSKKNAVHESIGQEFLSLQSSPFHFSIRALQPGQSLKSIYTKSTRLGVSRLQHSLQLMQTFFARHEGPDENPLLPLMGTVLKLANSGFEPDTNPANVLFDFHTGSFSLVDQCVRRVPVSSQKSAELLHASAEKLKQYVTFEKAITNEKNNPENTLWDAAEYEQYQALSRRFHVLVDDAVAQVKQQIGSKQKMAFAKVDGTQVVRLNEPPHTLREALRALDTRNHEAAR